jgi:serine/threonine-protein kinase
MIESRAAIRGEVILPTSRNRMSNATMTPRLSEMTYRVVKQLGAGAGSTILLISDKSNGGKRYALKVVKRQEESDEIYIAQVLTEFEASKRLNHPAILRIYDCRVRRRWFRIQGVDLLMEYVDGKTLDEIEAPDMGQLVLIFCQVASALTHMHRRGVFHGDIKPGNIMLAKDGQVKLIDFGTAWIRGEDRPRAGGTPQYVAPEQVVNKVVDDRTDIYNFGATMYRMFTGRYANLTIPGKNGGASRKLPAPIKINPAIPGTLNESIMSCLEWEPERRPAGIFEVHHQLSAVAKYLGLEEVDLRGFEDGE